MSQDNGTSTGTLDPSFFLAGLTAGRRGYTEKRNKVPVALFYCSEKKRGLKVVPEKLNFSLYVRKLTSNVKLTFSSTCLDS